ncbi:class I SAM-dependent methyltransferase [Nocardia niigatensis]
MSYTPDELFRSAATFYRRYRPGYPPAMFDYLTTRFGLDGTQTALDLGCGTGQIAIPLASRLKQVLAVDPSIQMLDEGRHAARDAGVGNVEWILGDSEHLHALPVPHGSLTLATMGQSFHWMNRDAVLRDFHTLLAPHGAVVIVGGGAPGTTTPPPWDAVIEPIRARYLGSERRAGSGTFQHPTEPYASTLGRSAFSQVDTVRWEWSIERDIDSIVGLQFSYSFSSAELFANASERAAFEADIRQALTHAFGTAPVREKLVTEALIATR